MFDHIVATSGDHIGVSLVDGDAAIRHARQIMLRSIGYNVRAYAAGAALLADPRSRDYPCIVLDTDLNEGHGIALLSEMRATGWRGKAILLDGIVPGGAVLRQAERHGDRVLERTVGNGSLVAAIAASVDRGWAG